jgi:death-on-curing protein
VPVWVSKALALAVHEEQLAEHGGGDGIRDEGLLDSALSRPENLEAYSRPDIADLAASYAYGIARNHPFIDGNKRTSAVVAELFLDLNGYAFLMSDEDVVRTWLALAAGDLSETVLAERIRASIEELV